MTKESEQAHHWQARLARYLPNGEMASHSHIEPWFCVVLGGEYEEKIGSISDTHSSGHMLFCPAGTPHSQRFSSRGAWKLLFSPPEACVRYVNACGIALEDAPYARSRAVARIGALAVCELQLADAHTLLALESLLLELVAEFARATPFNNETSVPQWLARTREIIEDAELDAPSISTLAARVGRHPVHVAREFHRYYGQTIGHYLRSKRAAKAAILLRASMMPLSEVALECGYAGQPSFARAFKAVYHMTPRAFRRSG